MTHGATPDSRCALAAAPAFALSIVLMIALGIGAHVAVYAVVDGLFLQPMPFGDRSDRLVTLHGTHPTQAPDWNDSEISYPDFLDFRRQSTTLAAIEGFLSRNVAISTGQDSDRVLAASIIDRTLTLANAAGPIKLRVIGVAPDLVYEEFGEETPQSQLDVYLPTAVAGRRTQALLINAASDPGSVTMAVRAAIRTIDPGIAVYDVMTMADRRAYNHWGNEFLGRTSSAFAVVALLLAGLGAYGIGAHAVAQRTREIGLRIALGSTREAITRLFLGLGGKLALLGVGGGAAPGVALARTLAERGELFRTSPWSFDVWIAPPVVLVAALMVASYLPARRASRVDPVVTLRSE